MGAIIKGSYAPDIMIYPKRINACIPKIIVRGVKSGKALDPLKLVQTADIVEPAGASLRIGGNAHKDDKDIQSCRDSHRYKEDPEHFVVFESVFFGGMRYAFKPNKSPR